MTEREEPSILQEEDQTEVIDQIQTTSPSREIPVSKDTDGKVISIGDTVYFNTSDKGKVLDIEKDRRVCIESWKKSIDDRPWKIVWLIPSNQVRITSD
jgi:hypothetical protein